MTQADKNDNSLIARRFKRKLTVQLWFSHISELYIK